jgi:hypothetical protein
MKQKIISLGAFFLLIGLPDLKAQSIWPSTINSTGGSGSIAFSTFDWSAGEMALVSTASTPSLIVTQGVLQPLVNDLGVAPIALNKALEVFPNPANSVLNIRFISEGGGTLAYKLMDVTGKVLMAGNMPLKRGANTQQLDMAGLAAASYILQVSPKGATMSGETAYTIQKLR